MFIRSETRQKQLVVPGNMQNYRLDLVISKLLNRSRKQAKYLIESGYVLVNRTKATFASRRVLPGDKIVCLAIKPSGRQTPHALEIIYEDAVVLAVDKPPGVLTNKIGSEHGRSAEELLFAKGLKVYPVHRLDRETSGVLLFAKTRHAQHLLMEQFKRREVKKKYIGIVDGILRKKEGLIKGLMIGGHEYGETFFRVQKELKNATIVEFVPLTGRTHQIRLQLAGMGYSLVGEKKYLPYRQKTNILFPRVALHALEIEFMHPAKGNRVKYSCPLAADIQKLIGSLT